MRLNKFLSRCGVDSRRKCDEIIFQKRVTVNGKIVDNPAIDIDIHNDNVLVDLETITLKKKFTYIKLNKPEGYISTTEDPHRSSCKTNCNGVTSKCFGCCAGGKIG